MRGIMTISAIGLALAASPWMAGKAAAADDEAAPAALSQTANLVSKDQAAAIARWRTRAAAGDIEAQYNLGQAYRQGNGVPEDPVEAEAWYRKAADRGHMLAQARLGLMLFTSTRRQESYVWLDKAATQGEPRAQYVMGNALFNGNDIPRNLPRAYAMMSRAAAAGLDPAKQSLATMENVLSASDKQAGAALASAMAARGAAPSTGAPRLALAPVADAAKAVPAPASAAPAPAPAPAPVRTAAAKKAPLSPRPAGGWRVQLGAFARIARRAPIGRSFRPGRRCAA